MSMEAAVQSSPTTDHGAKLRVIYRAGSGEIHFDWPPDRVADALHDHLGTVWIDIDDPGAADNRGVEALLRDVFHFHPLAIEDALHDTHIPTIDDWGSYLYMVFSSIDFDPGRALKSAPSLGLSDLASVSL